MNSPEISVQSTSEESCGPVKSMVVGGGGNNTEFETLLQSLLFEKMDELKSRPSVNPMELITTSSSWSHKQQQQKNVPINRPRYHSIIPVMSIVHKSISEGKRGRRNSHLESEKRRRVCMRDCYDRLAALLPEETLRMRLSKANILNAACDYLEGLREKCEEIEVTNEAMMQRRHSV